jgi:hypothetical protein
MSGVAYAGISQAIVRSRLGGLIAQGLTPSNVGNKAHELLRMEIVQERRRALEDERLNAEGDESDVDEDDTADELDARALTEVLKQAVAQIQVSNYRRILKRVLPLKPGLVGTPIAERRTAAASAFRHERIGDEPVVAETIRTYHEPRALDELARTLVEMEAKYRGEALPSA